MTCPYCNAQGHNEDEVAAEWLEANLPAFLKRIPAEWFCPTWRCMDGGPPRVYAIDAVASEKAGRPLLEDSY